LFLLIVMAMVYRNRQKLIVAPMVKFLANLFLKDNDPQPMEEMIDEQPAE